MAGLGDKRLRLCRIVGIIRHFGRAAELDRHAERFLDRLAFADEVLRDRLAVDGVEDRAAHAHVLQRRVAGAPGGVEREEGHAHGRGRLHDHVWHGAELLRILGRHAPDPVDAAGQELGDLSFGILDGAVDDRADLRLTLGAAGEIIPGSWSA